MYEVHKFMALDEHEVGWFVTNVGKSAASFGVTDDDVATVGKALLDTFGMNCAAPVAIPATAEPALQAICIEVRILFFFLGIPPFLLPSPLPIDV